MKQLDITNIIACYIVSTNLLEIEALPTHKAIYWQNGTARQTNNWNNKQKYEMALLVAECLIGSRNHRDTDLGYYLGNVAPETPRTGTSLRERFGQPNIGTSRTEGFVVFNDAFDVFAETRAAISNAQPAAYDFTTSFKKKLNDLFPKTGNFSFLNLFQWQQHQPPEHDVYSEVKLNQQAIENALNDPDVDLKDPEKWHLFAIYVYTNRNSVFPQYYRRNKTNRLYTFGCFGLQSVSKRMRKIIFKGWHCYDMQAASYNILLSKIEPKQLHKFPYLQQYAQDRKRYRQKIATDTQQPIEHVKTGLTAILFGSDLANSVKSQIPKITRQAIAAHQLTEAMAKELQEMRQEIVKARNLTKHEQRIRDDIEKELRKEAEQKGKSRVYWKRHFMVWLYQTEENKALMIMRDLLSTPEECLLLHDGLYTQEAINPADFETAIQKQTGLNIKVDKE
ncbi:hypothetical protein ACXAAV_15115 [Vibrio coralliilyticus]